MAARPVRKPLLYGANGQVVKAAYEATSMKPRTRGWVASSLHVNSIIPHEVSELRRKQRDAERKNPYAIAARETTISNLVGNGVVPILRIEDPGLREEVKEAWDDWTEESDPELQQDFYGQQATLVYGAFSGGDSFVRFRDRRTSDGLSVPLQLQLLDADMVDEGKNESLRRGRMTKAGIEFDALGRRASYWIFRAHPQELQTNFGTTEPVRVPAEQVAHMFHQFVPGQVRGFPWAAAALTRMYELDQYDDAEVIRKKIAAMFAGFITSNDDNVFGEGDEEGEDEHEVPLAALEPGTLQELDPGQEITFSAPTEVGGSYEAFMKVQLRALASALGVTYHQLTGDLKDVNFSTIRAVLIEQRRRYQQIQRNMIIFRVCRPVWRRWVTAAVLSGRISIPRTNADQVMRKLLRPRWVSTPKWDWVQPDKQVQADLEELAAGLTSRTRLITERGYDPEQLDQEIQDDKEREARHGLSFEQNKPHAMTEEEAADALRESDDAAAA